MVCGFVREAVAGALLLFSIFSIDAVGQEQAEGPKFDARITQEQKVHPTLAIGSPAPDFSLPGTDDKVHKLSDYQASRLLVVMFTCNHCPMAQLYETRLKKLVDDYQSKDVAFVAIEPNDPNAVQLSELGYTDVSDSLEEMKIRAEYRHFNFPYLYDGETQSVARAYGPRATPHLFIFDRERKLQYEGRVDNSPREALVKRSDARTAIDQLLAGRAVTVPHTGAFGCTTKWKSKIDGRLREAKEIAARPVTLEMASAQDLKALRANPTGKVLLINFWATWCGPCVEELPKLEETYQMYRRRDFDMVTVSATFPDEKAAALKMLQNQHASNRNLIFGSDDTYAMQAAFDPHWDAGVPFTMVLAPGGKVIYQELGELDILAMRRAILASLGEDTGYPGHSAYWAKQ